MSDITQGQDAALFREASDAETLDRFENPPEAEPKPEPKVEPKPEPQEPDGPPSGRLREEAEARRRAEREASDLRARLAAYEVQRPATTQQAPKLDVFDNPSGFVKQEVEPLLAQFKQEMQMTREAMSADNAVRVYGEQSVSSARAALEQGMARHDPNAWATYNRAMSSHDPYGVITRWHMDRSVLQEIGGNLETYKQRILDEAMSNPDFQKKVIEAVRGQTTQQVMRPAAQSTVPTLPSLSDIGAAGGDEQMQEPSEDALFRAAVTAKRRR